MKKLQTYLIFILFPLVVGALSGLAVSSGMNAFNQLEKPALEPPAMIFPIVWTILYILMGIGAARVWLYGSESRKAAIKIFLLQLAVNFFWSILFFGLQARFLAFLWLVLLWVLILVMIISFYKLDRLSAYLQIPYLLWVTFAGYLNFSTWMLNR